MTDVQIIDAWLAMRSEHTARAYRGRIDRLCTWLDKRGRRLTTANAQDLAEYTRTLTDLRPASVATHVAAIRSLYTYATRARWVRSNPADLLRPPKIPDSGHLRYLSADDVDRLRTTAAQRGLIDRLIVDLLYYSGCRVDELAHLTWADVQPREGGHVQATVTGKGRKVRSVLLPPRIGALLQAVPPDERAGCVLRSRARDCMSTRQIARRLLAVALAAGLSAAISPHWLRHAHISHSLDAGAPAHVVRESVGHSSLSTTTRYAHARPSDGSALYLDTPAPKPATRGRKKN